MYELHKPICSVGCGRSGTNFLARAISQCEDIAFLYAPKYIWRHGNSLWKDDCLTADHARPSVVRYIRRRFAQYLQSEGKRRLFEHTQANVLALSFVNAVLPDSKIIHIIRDGRDVAVSLRESRMKRGTEVFIKQVRKRMRIIPLTDILAYFPEFSKNLWIQLLKKEAYTFGPKILNWKKLYKEYDLLEFSAITWRECVTAAIRFGRTLPPGRYHEIRFEDLFIKTNDVIAQLFDFLELPQSELVKRYIHENIDNSAKGRYKKKLSQEENDKILRHAGDLLRELNML
jgi:hypothetical protein